MNTKYQALFLTVAASVLLTGCENPDGTVNHTGSGALIGGGLGATTGAIVGGRHAGEGAIIGGVLGAITGSIIGNSMDQQQRARLQQQAPQTYQRIDQGQPLSTADVKALAHAGITDDNIISQIKNTRTVYHLSADEIIDLSNSGVSQTVINYMINTANTAGVPAPSAQVLVVEQAPPPPMVETVVVAPGPDYVWIGGEWVWSGRWVWMSGHWMYPPRPHGVWVSGSWGHGPRGWEHHPGHWR